MIFEILKYISVKGPIHSAAFIARVGIRLSYLVGLYLGNIVMILWSQIVKLICVFRDVAPRCHTSATPTPHQCHTSATPTPHHCHTTAALMVWHWCGISVAFQVPHQCHTNATPVPHRATLNKISLCEAFQPAPSIGM